MNAACAGHSEPLWDAVLDGETDAEQAARHARALAFCRICPIRRECAASVDVKTVDGIWGGLVLPTIRDTDRRSPAGWVPGRGGLADVLSAVAS